MAFSKPIRVFFGQFIVPAGNTYAERSSLGVDDQVYHRFLTGKIHDNTPGIESYVHTRIPAGTNGLISNWDEYLDLTTASLSETSGNELTLYRDLSGTEDEIAWVNETDATFLPKNKLAIHSNLNDWFKKTHRLTYPYPSLLEPVPKITYVDQGGAPVKVYSVWIYVTGGGGDSSAVQMQVNKYAADDTLTFLIDAKDTITIGDAELVAQTITGEKLWSDFPLERIQAYDLAAGGDAHIVVTAHGGVWKVAIDNYFARAYTADFVTLPCLNDAMARVAFDYDKRHRIDPTNNVFSQRWLVLNSETMKYYIGTLYSISDAFLVGTGKRSANDAQVVLQILEEGSFLDTAWTDPNTAVNLIKYVRVL